MLILKCTQKAAKELGKTRSALPEISPDDNETLLGDWFVNPLRFGYTKILLFTNAPTLYSILIEYKKKDLVDVGHLFRSHLKFNLLQEGIAGEKIESILAEYNEVVLAKTDSRSVLGSMNDLAWLYECHIKMDGGITAVDLGQAIRKVNRTPQLTRGGKYSIKLMKGRIGTIGN